MLRDHAEAPGARVVRLAALTAVLIAVLAAVGAAALSRAATARAATVTIEPATVGAPVPAGFLGLSTEVHNLEDYAGSDPNAIDPAFLHLLAAIGPGGSPVLRLAGDSTDWSWYPVAGQKRPPGVTYTITPQWLNIARHTAQAIHGKLIIGVNLEADDKAVAVGDADAFVKQIGAKYIDALEIGNEPELYAHFAWYHTASGAAVLGRPHATWTQSLYHEEYSSFAKAMPKVPLAGPVSGVGTWLKDLGGFLHAEPEVALTTIHAYPLKHCSASHILHIPELLSDANSEGFAKQVSPYVAVSHRAGKPIRIDEVNAISCGGFSGVSDSFASALWMLDTLFGLARTGVDGINVHTRPDTANSILNPVGKGSNAAMEVQPEYYAMIMFARAVPPGARLMTLDGSPPPGIKAWAAMAPDGTVHVVLIDKRTSGASTVRLALPGATGPATVQRLTAPSLAATGDVTLAGQTFGKQTQTGELTGTPQTQSVVPFGGGYDVSMNAGSAATVTLNASPAALLLSSVSAALQRTW